MDPWVGKIPWRRERLPTPVFRPGEFHGLYSPWGHKELYTAERLSLSQTALLKNGQRGFFSHDFLPEMEFEGFHTTFYFHLIPCGFF